MPTVAIARIKYISYIRNYINGEAEHAALVIVFEGVVYANDYVGVDALRYELLSEFLRVKQLCEHLL